jgi:hypothetical protein
VPSGLLNVLSERGLICEEEIVCCEMEIVTEDPICGSRHVQLTATNNNFGI